MQSSLPVPLINSVAKFPVETGILDRYESKTGVRLSCKSRLQMIFRCPVPQLVTGAPVSHSEALSKYCARADSAVVYKLLRLHVRLHLVATLSVTHKRLHVNAVGDHDVCRFMLDVAGVSCDHFSHVLLNSLFDILATLRIALVDFLRVRSVMNEFEVRVAESLRTESAFFLQRFGFCEEHMLARAPLGEKLLL